VAAPRTTGLLDPAYLSALSGYALMARLAVEGFISGMHRSRFHGFGTEFLQYRAYTPGEDLRTIDWKAYARRDRLQTKVFQEETNLTCTILLDASGSMDYQGRSAACSKFHYAAMVAAALIHLAQRQGDKIGLYIYQDTIIDAVPANRNGNRMAPLYHSLQRARPAGNANHERALDYIGHHLSGRGIFVHISDMQEVETTLPAQLARIRIRHHDTLALQILDKDEVTLPRDDAARFIDLESGAERVTSPRTVADAHDRAAAEAGATLRDGCVQRGIEFQRFLTDASLGKAIAAFLHQRKLAG
jgi:uncharacterized protein (DUF58 family)